MYSLRVIDDLGVVIVGRVAPATTPERAPYHKPEIEELGSLKEMTAGGGGYQLNDSGYGVTTGNPFSPSPS